MIEKGLWPLFFIPGTAGFDTLRTQASIRFATQPARIHCGLSGPPKRSVSKDTSP
jgi:hypothetical protein